jgi:hypothetical protein
MIFTIYLINLLNKDIKIIDENYIIEHNYDDYKIIEIYNILTPQECETLINLAKIKGLQTSEVLTYQKEKPTEIDNGYRNSEQAWLEDNYHQITMKIAKFSEKITGLPI